MNRRAFLMSSCGIAGLAAATLGSRFVGRTDAAEGTFPVSFSESEWRERLTPEEFYILREHGTERAYTSDLLAEKRDGTFTCAGCDQPLYSSATKYDSGTGWPSYWEAIEGGVGTSVDNSLFMTRTEVHCSRCGGHLGHIFDDGPEPTGKRHCINGVALDFVTSA